MVPVKGTPEQRKRAREANRLARHADHIRQMGLAARTGHDLVVAATQAAKSISRRLDDATQRQFATAIAKVAERYDPKVGTQ